MNIQELIVAVQNGLNFQPMEDADYEAFAGAPDGSLIATSDIAIYILSGNTLAVFTEDGENRYELGQL